MKRTMMSAAMLLAMTGAGIAADQPAAPDAAAPAHQMLNCGEKVKSMMPLPTKFEELMMSVSNNMEAHAKVMSMSKDKNSQAEAKAFRKLASDHKEVAHQMKKIIKDMEAAGKLAAAPHDMSKPDPKAGEAMMNQAKLEREMAALMVKNAEETEKAMAATKGASAKK